jgi:hypothetical protein
MHLGKARVKSFQKALLYLALKTPLQFLKGHDFSRAANTGEIVAALAAEVCSSSVDA